MTAKLIDGKAIAASVRAAVKERVAELTARTGIRPGLTVVLVGEDPASQVYVRNKGKAASEAGFLSRQIDLPAETKESELLDLVARLNADDTVHGILVQLPLPEQIDENEGDRGDRSVQGRRRVPSRERGAPLHGRRLVPPVHAVRHPHHAGLREGGA